jgi:formate dehydrogenase subunit beta
MRRKYGGKVMKGNMYIARASAKEKVENAECGGAVTALLKHALDSGRVDAVLAVEARGGDRFDGVPALVSDESKVNGLAGALHCASPNIARFIKEYLDGSSNQKIAVVVKPCDARAIIELAKRDQIVLDNLLLIGLNCTGTLPAAKAKQMLRDEFEVDPADVIAEDIEDNKLAVKLRDGTWKEKDLSELERKGVGRRDNCRRCDTNIPTMADIACGKWGATDGNTTFIEVCSDKGAWFIDSAVEAGYIEVEKPTEAAVQSRKDKDEAAIRLAWDWQERDFAELRDMSSEDKLSYWSGQFGHCVKCYGCRDACPICYCKECQLEAKRGLVSAGQIPPDITFPLIRIAHVMDSCVNCGQCQDACTMEIPIARLIFMLSKEISSTFEYIPGTDVGELPPLRSINGGELSNRGFKVAC